MYTAELVPHFRSRLFENLNPVVRALRACGVRRMASARSPRVPRCIFSELYDFLHFHEHSVFLGLLALYSARRREKKYQRVRNPRGCSFRTAAVRRNLRRSDQPHHFSRPKSPYVHLLYELSARGPCMRNRAVQFAEGQAGISDGITEKSHRSASTHRTNTGNAVQV